MARSSGTEPWPAGEGGRTGRQPKQRRYVLQQAKNLRMTTLYAGGRWPGARVHKVLPVCPMVAFNDPTAQVDPTGNLHILCQSGARIQLHRADPDGKMKIRHHYQIVGSRPRLNFKDGKIQGCRRPETPSARTTSPPKEEGRRAEAHPAEKRQHSPSRSFRSRFPSPTDRLPRRSCAHCVS